MIGRGPGGVPKKLSGWRAAFGTAPNSSRGVMRAVGRHIDPETDADHAIQWMAHFRAMPPGAQVKAVRRLMKNPKARAIANSTVR